MANKTQINALITGSNIVVNFNGTTHTVNKENDASKYAILKELIKNKDEEGIFTLLSPKVTIVKYANEHFTVTDDGKLWMKDTKEEIPHVIALRLLDLINEGLGITSLINFWKNLRQNPSKESREDLYGFLEKNKHPITPEGGFIAYKKVTSVNGKWMDSHTRTIHNKLGSKVSMPREKVNPDRNQTCSAGLHVAALEYASGFSGDVLIEVVINPRDVVAVPTDYNNQKMRVCEYIVLGEVIKPNETKPQDKARKDAILALIPKEKDVKSHAVVSKTSIPYDKSKDINLSGLTARGIVEIVEKITGKKWLVNLKNKQSIIRHAEAKLINLGYNVTI